VAIGHSSEPYGHEGPVVTTQPVDARSPISAEPHEIRRLDVGDGIYVRVAPYEAAAEGRDHPNSPAATRAWKLRPTTGLAAAGLAGIALIRIGVTPQGMLAAGVLAVLVVLASIDLQARVLPNVILLPATAAVLAWQLAFFPASAREWILAALGAGFFVLVPALIRPGAMGMGDVKLAVLLGAALGRDVLTALTIGFLALLPVAMWLLIRGRGVRGATVPLGPFLAFGAALVLVV
jgi:leader peptidase (prepilin peptidase)/N-methyltransferase